ncbi:MAG: cadherin-like beta sandwich domain-containing protein, partial [Gammaproteobacteria bacterium]
RLKTLFAAAALLALAGAADDARAQADDNDVRLQSLDVVSISSDEILASVFNEDTAPGDFSVTLLQEEDSPALNTEFGAVYLSLRASDWRTDRDFNRIGGATGGATVPAQISPPLPAIDDPFGVELEFIPDDAAGIVLSPGIPRVVTINVLSHNKMTTGTFRITITREVKGRIATLQSLALSGGAMLSPRFSPAVQTYSAVVAPEVANVTVTPVVAESGATVQVDGADVASGAPSGPIALTLEQPKTILVVVSARSGGGTKTYTLRVTRASAANTNLSGLRVSGVAALSPPFSAGVTEYTASVAHAVTAVTVTPAAFNANAVVRVANVIVARGAASGGIALTVNAPKTILVVVSAQSGGGTKTYTLRITRMPSADATLSGLSLSGGVLASPFSADVTEYTASVANNVSGVRITPSANQADATLTVDGAAVNSGSASAEIGLIPGMPKAIVVAVTAPDGATMKTYTLTVTRMPGDAALSGLSLSGDAALALDPVFSSAQTSYAAVAAPGVSSIRVTPVVKQAGSTLSVDGSPVASGAASGEIQLVAGVPKVILVVVTTGDGVTMKTYAVTVYSGSDDTTLLSLTVTGGTTFEFAYDEMDLANAFIFVVFTAPSDVPAVRFTPVAKHAGATLSVVENLASGDIVIPFASGTTTEDFTLTGVHSIVITVTAQNGRAMQNYTVLADRAGSKDATLSSLLLRDQTLSPNFSPAENSYTALVPNRAAAVSVTPVVNLVGATVTVDGAAVMSGEASAEIQLVAGVPKVILVVVTARDTNFTNTYSITATRQLSDDATLHGLTLFGNTSPDAVLLEPLFAPMKFTYTAGVANGVSGVRITPVLNDAFATLTLDGTAADSGVASAEIPLTAGQARDIVVVVTAQDGRATATYTITATRQLSDDATLRGLSLFDTSSDAVSLQPMFAPMEFRYTAGVANGVSGVRITPVLNDALATVSVDGTEVGSGSASAEISLVAGIPKNIVVAVTAQDGMSTNSYALTVTRDTAAAAAPDAPEDYFLAPDRNAIKIVWSAPANNGSAISGYRYRWSHDGDDSDWESENGAAGVPIANSALATRHTITGLAVRRYAIQLAAHNRIGLSAWSSSQTSAPFFDLDVDQSGAVDEIDGQFIERYLDGARGDALLAGLVTQASDAQVVANITRALQSNILNVDAAGGTTLTDGMLIARYLLGVTDPAALTDGLTGGDLAEMVMHNISAALTDLNINQVAAADWQDGVLIARYLAGMRGAALRANLGAPLPAADVAARIQGGVLSGALDVDGENEITAADGIMLRRYLSGLRGAELTAGQSSVDGADVEANIASLCGVSTGGCPAAP